MNGIASVKKSTSSALTEDDKQFADQLNAYLQSRDRCYYEMGRHIMEYLGNDLGELSNRSSKKNKSLRKICKELVNAVSVSEIHRLAHVANQDDFFKEKEVDISSASYSLKAELVPLPNNDEKIALINEAMKDKWSVRKLREGVKGKKGGTKKARKATESAKPQASDFSRISENLRTVAEYLNPLKQNLETMQRDQLVTLRDETLQGQSLLKSLETEVYSLLEAMNDRLEALGDESEG
jgi:hypothetical protein